MKASEAVEQTSPEDLEDLQERIREGMERLAGMQGDIVIVEYILGHQPKMAAGVVKKINPFGFIDLGHQGMAFIGTDGGIKAVRNQEGHVIYANPLIDERYPRRQGENDEMREKCFGRAIAESVGGH